ncbi:hypothetical protein C8Q80DRAFT_252041 [Daedaleopsis nitida]|nr:hypothetical protein C8Q80DRAFT_252041 [Daedaleopsis nitida]
MVRNLETGCARDSARPDRAVYSQSVVVDETECHDPQSTALSKPLPSRHGDSSVCSWLAARRRMSINTRSSGWLEGTYRARCELFRVIMLCTRPLHTVIVDRFHQAAHDISDRSITSVTVRSEWRGRERMDFMGNELVRAHPLPFANGLACGTMRGSDEGAVTSQRQGSLFLREGLGRPSRRVAKHCSLGVQRYRPSTRLDCVDPILTAPHICTKL